MTRAHLPVRATGRSWPGPSRRARGARHRLRRERRALRPRPPAGVGAMSAAVENAANGKLLWSRGLNTERPMASITKVMTAYIVIKTGDLGRTITIPSAVAAYVQQARRQQRRPAAAGTSSPPASFSRAAAPVRRRRRLCPRQGLRPGYPGVHHQDERHREAAGHEADAFQQLRRAALSDVVLELLHRREPAHPRPRRDEIPVFRSIVNRRSYRLAAGSGHHAYLWANLNPLLGRYPGAIGIKPGYTRAAGQCLLFEATRNGRSSSASPWTAPAASAPSTRADATRILNWAFSRPRPSARIPQPKRCRPPFISVDALSCRRRLRGISPGPLPPPMA